MKNFVDRHCQQVDYEVGDLVFLKLRPYCQASLAKCRHEKLSPKYFGHYPIEERIGKVAYKLRLLEGTSIHPMFHVSQLKKLVGNVTKIQPKPPQ